MKKECLNGSKIPPCNSFVAFLCLYFYFKPVLFHFRSLNVKQKRNVVLKSKSIITQKPYNMTSVHITGSHLFTSPPGPRLLFMMKGKRGEDLKLKCLSLCFLITLISCMENASFIFSCSTVLTKNKHIHKNIKEEYCTTFYTATLFSKLSTCVWWLSNITSSLEIRNSGRTCIWNNSCGKLYDLYIFCS